jgi:hypothetical protein
VKKYKKSSINYDDNLPLLLQVGIGDTVIIYVLGHGYVVDEQLYIVCSDTISYTNHATSKSGMTP